MSNSQRMIGILGFVVVLGTGIENAWADCPEDPTGYTCVCNAGFTRWVCAKFDQGGDPTHGVDFFVTYTGDIPEVKFAAADDGWELYSEALDEFGVPSGLAAIGDILLASDVSPDTGDFEVSIIKGFALGATDVSSIVLDSSDVNWTGGSTLEGLAISGDVNGAITLVQDGQDPPQGGEITGALFILGDVAGLITVPTITASGSLQIGSIAGSGNVDEGFVIDLLDGVLNIKGTLPDGKSGDIKVLGTGAFKIGTVAAGAMLHLRNGIPESATHGWVDILEGTLDLHGADIRSDLVLLSATSSGRVDNGGIIAGAIFYPAELTGHFAGQATFASVAAGGQIWAFDASGNASISGKITIINDYAGLFRVDGDFTSTAELIINGDLKENSGNDGLIWIVNEAAGEVIIKKDLIGHVHYPKTFAAGSVTVEQNVTSSGLFKTGDNATGETHAGSLILKGDVLGDILIHGNMSGDVTITGAQSGDLTIDDDLSGDVAVSGNASGDITVSGDMTSTGSVTVSGALANDPVVGGGRIMIAGDSSGAIKVGKQTESLTLIHLAGGLGANGTVEINTTKGNFDADGDIQVGRALRPTATPMPPPITFDGCIHIYNDAESPPSGGDLNGDLKIFGCHGSSDDLNICVDGDDNNNIFIFQTGCTYQVVWSCGTWTCAPA